MQLSLCMNKRALGLLAVTSVLLAGCASTHWEKFGGTQGEFEQMKAACMVEGHNNVPAKERTVLLSDGYYRQTNDCHKQGCSTYGDYMPPRYGVVDENEDLRNQVVRACFYRNGWQEVEDKK